MKCENCGEREAVVHVTKIINNEKHSITFAKHVHSMNTLRRIT